MNVAIEVPNTGGKWWFANDGTVRLFVVGLHPDTGGIWVVTNAGEAPWCPDIDWSQYHIEINCTGWNGCQSDGASPRWYIGADGSVYRRDSLTSHTWIREDGSEVLQAGDARQLFDCSDFREVEKAEADRILNMRWKFLGVVKPLFPPVKCQDCGEHLVASHPEVCAKAWVTQDRVPKRANVDQYVWLARNELERSVKEELWTECTDQRTKRMHGFVNYAGHTLHVRCRREDLPVSTTLDCAMCGVNIAVPGKTTCDDCYAYAVESTGCPGESPFLTIPCRNCGQMPGFEHDKVCPLSWVLIDHRDFVFSDKIEQRRLCGNAQWKPCDPSIHGHHCSDEPWWPNYEFRCRREDLPAPEPGAGFRAINPAVDVPQEGDETWAWSGDGMGWTDRVYCQVFDVGCHYRRRITTDLVRYDEWFRGGSESNGQFIWMYENNVPHGGGWFKTGVSRSIELPSDVSTENNKPKAGEFWVHKAGSERIEILASADPSYVIFRKCKGGFPVVTESVDSWRAWRHEPSITSWE